MVYRDGTEVSVIVEFPTGAPTGSVQWAVYDESGSILDSGSVTPAAGAVSTVLVVPSADNILAPGDLNGFRDFHWSYMLTSGEVVNDDLRYTIEARPPWGATPGGVRTKLGLEPADLPDEEISLVRAYYDFLVLMSEPDLTGFTPSARERLALSDAIEAIAALTVLPTLQMRTAIKESSGTDTYQRHKIDWELLASNLRTMVTDGILVIVPTFDPLAGAGSIFLLASPASDPITGA